MKARVKATGYIIDVELYYITPRIKTYTDGSQYYNGDELDFNVNYDSDYWTRLEHQYAGMVLLGLSTRGAYGKEENIADYCYVTAHALVEKLKEKEEK